LTTKVAFFPHNNSLYVLRHRGILERSLPDVVWTDVDEYGRSKRAEAAAGGRLDLPTLHSDGLYDGACDFIGTGSTPPVTAQAHDRDIVYVAISGPRVENGALVVRDDSPITSLADLRGARIGLAHGSWQTTLVLLALEKAGLSWSDIQPVPVGLPDGAQKFLDGELDAWVGAHPSLTRVQREAAVRPLVPTAELFSHRSVWWTRRDFAEQHRAELAAIVAALQESDAEIVRNPQEAAEIFARHDGVPVDDWEYALRTRPFGLYPVTDDFIAEQQKAAELFLAAGLIDRPVTVAKAVLPDLAELVTAAPAAPAAVAGQR
jgi:sulfonate transport system substrate-binding protein